MRILRFEPDKEGRIRWDICYGGLLVNPEGYSGHTRRVVSRILSRFEGIGKPVPDAGSIAKFELGDTGGEVGLEEAEHKLLINILDEKVRWTRESIRTADDTILWLEGIKEGPVAPAT
jgi:hypothetical protein